MPRQDLQDLQSLLLQKQVARVSSVPFYRKKLEEAKLSPEAFKGLAELKKLPFTTKQDLRDNYPGGMIACPESELRRFHASSGTRGKPTIVAYSSLDLANWADLGARCLYAAGVRPGDLVHNAYGYGLFTGGLGMHGAAERLGAVCIPASGGKTQVQITVLKDLKAKVLLATPSYSLRLADSIAEAGLSREEFALEIGIFGAEPWTEPMRKRIEAELGIKAFDIYGLSEVMGPGVSMECQEQNGLHIWEDHFLVETICPGTLENLPPGTEGELVITTLQKEAMPVLRYRTGDLCTLNEELCACGRTMQRMTRVKARIDDMLIVRGVNVYPSEIENILLNIDELAPHYQLVLRKENSMDELAVQVELTQEIVSRWAEIDEDGFKLRQLNKKIKESIKESLGLTVSVELLPASTIQRSEGKAIRLIDQRMH